jgi:uncharacterized protein (TIGR02246 family)
MTNEQQIRELIHVWMNATKEGNIQAVLDLMTDDVVFLVAGQPSFGKDEFKKSAEQMKESNIQFQGESNIEEIKIIDNWAFARTKLKVTTTSNRAVTHRSGYTLTIYNKGIDGKWKLARDANLLSEEKH